MADIKLLKLSGGDLKQHETTDQLTELTSIQIGTIVAKDTSNVLELKNAANDAYKSLKVLDATITGNLTVSGTTTAINTTEMTINDNSIILNADATGDADATIEVERGSTGANASIKWDSSTTKWKAGVIGSESNILLATDTIPVGNGGTGQTSYTDGQLLIGNTTGNTLAKAILTQGTGILITNGHGTIEIAATGGGSATETPVVKNTYTAGTGGIAQNDVVYVSGNDTVLKADADSINTSRVIGIATNTASVGASVYVAVSGILACGSGWTAGNPVYLSITAGAMTTTAPSETSDCIVHLGIAKNTTTLQIQIQPPIILS